MTKDVQEKVGKLTAHALAPQSADGRLAAEDTIQVGVESSTDRLGVLDEVVRSDEVDDRPGLESRVRCALRIQTTRETAVSPKETVWMLLEQTKTHHPSSVDPIGLALPSLTTVVEPARLTLLGERDKVGELVDRVLALLEAPVLCKRR